MSPTIVVVLAEIDPHDETRSFIRVAILILVIFLIGFAWLWLRRRHAMRTVESWRGTGICPDLNAAEAALLTAAHPGIIVAAAVEPILSSGRAKATSGRPMGLVWPKGGPADPLEVALDRALAEGGDHVHGALGLLYAVVDHKVATYSGRATAVHLRAQVREVRRRALSVGRLEVADRAWLLLDDPNALWDEAPAGPERETYRDLVRFGGLFRSRLLADIEVQAAAYARRNAFWKFRSDLRRDRIALGPWMAASTDADSWIPTGPLGDTARGLARALGGTVSGHGAWPLPFTYQDSPGLIVEGRCDDRPVTLEFRDDGTLQILVRSRQDGRLSIVNASFVERLHPLPPLAFETGDEEFDRRFLLREIDEPGGPAWLAARRVRDRIMALEGLERLRVDRERIRCDVPYDRTSIRTGPVLEQVRAACALAETLRSR